jgi:hypothetical protein
MAALFQLRILAQTVFSLRRLTDEVKVKITWRLTVSPSVSLGVDPHLGPMTRYLLIL